MNCFV